VRGKRKRRGARYCYVCETVVPTAARCSCGSAAFYRATHPRRETTGALMDRLHWDEREQPPAETSYGTPIRRRGYKGARPQ